MAATVLGRSPINVILLFGITGSPIFDRVTRGEVMRLRQSGYVEAAHSIGAGNSRILLRHIFPNLIGPLVTLATFASTGRPGSSVKHTYRPLSARVLRALYTDNYKRLVNVFGPCIAFVNASVRGSQSSSIKKRFTQNVFWAARLNEVS